MAFKRRLRFDKRIKFKKKMSIMYILLFVVMLSLGVGYSYIKSDLNINGTAQVKNAKFDIHFENLNVVDNSVTATTPASITNDTTIEFAATLENPEDAYTFTVDVVNNGTMDAKIDSINISPQLTSDQQKYLLYNVAYKDYVASDGVEIKEGDALNAGETVTLMVEFMYKANSDTSLYPTEDVTLNCSVSLNYIQGKGN